MKSLFKKSVSISTFALTAEVSVKLAVSQSELDQSFSLLYEKSVGVKRVDPQNSGLHAEFFSMLPNTTTVIAKMGSQVIAAISMIRDSGFSLPSDLFYPEQNDEARRNKKTLIEIAALSIACGYSSHQDDLTLLLLKFCYNYSMDHSAEPQIVMVTKPSQKDYFHELFHFQKKGPSIRHGAWLGKPSICLAKDLSDAAQKTWTESFASKDPKKNIALFSIQNDSRFEYPESKSGQLIHPVMTPALLKHFQQTNKNVWTQMKRSEKSSILSIYSTYFPSDLTISSQEVDLMKVQNKDYRAPIQLPVHFNFQQEVCFGEMKDLSPGGCFIQVAGELPAAGSTIELSFKLGSASYIFNAEVSWTNGNTRNSKNKGIGIRFLKKQTTIRQNLQKWLYEKNKSVGYDGAKSDFSSPIDQINALIHFDFASDS